MPAQFAQVDVTFLVNQDGILSVTAKEQRSGVHAQVTLQPAHGLSRDEIESLVADSIKHAKADFTMRRLIELRNKADADLRHTRKALADAGSRLTPQQANAIETATSGLREAIAGDDLQRLQEALERFGAATNPLATIVMNEVMRKALGGSDPVTIEPRKL
jgi:molecular chaperone DnaK (HSP70)